MDHMTVSETAARWGVSERWVHKYLKDGRVKGALRFGAVWMIPSGAKKPRDPRYNKATSQMSLQDELDHAITEVHEHHSTRTPQSLLIPDISHDSQAPNVSHGPNTTRAFPAAENSDKLNLSREAAYAYLRGDFKHVKHCYEQAGSSDAVKLLVSAISIPASIGMGDYAFFQDAERWLKEIVSAGHGAGVTAYAQYALAGGYMGAHAPDMVAGWVKEGDFSALHPLARYEAINRRADYLYYMKKYGSMLETVQTAVSLLGFSKNSPSGAEATIMGINLRIRCAVACHALGRVDDAKRWLIGTMETALPSGFITPFAENATLLGDLTEQCLKQAYPEWYDAVFGLAGQTLANWIAFHNRFTKDNITLILTLREMGIARLAVQRVPYKTIAEQYHISLGRLKSIMSEIYGKLYVHNRAELSKYIP